MLQVVPSNCVTGEVPLADSTLPVAAAGSNGRCKTT